MSDLNEFTLHFVFSFHFAGYFAFINTNSPRVQGDKARLLSPVYPDTLAECAQIWYHMYGSGIGTFNVFTYDLISEQYSDILFTKTGKSC